MDHVFNENVTQEEVFQEIGEPILKSFIGGYNCTIFCYGQTGAGKTHTMMGPLEQLFDENSLKEGLKSTTKSIDTNRKNRSKSPTITKNNAQINNVQNNIQNIAPINAQNNIQDNIPNIVPDNAQNEIQHAEDIHVDPNIVPMIPQRVNENVHDNLQNYVTQNEFNNFKDSVNNQFQLVKDQLQQINKGIEDLKGEMKNDFKAINERVNNIENRIGIR